MSLWWCQTHIRHEIGHCFGLLHTYGGSCCPENIDCSLITNPDFLSDVFPTGNSNCASSSAPCNNCFEDNGLYSNNVMGGQPTSNWYSPLQVGRMRRNLHIGSMRVFAKEMTSDYTTPWTITSSEVWDFDTQLYQDIIVKPGAVLTIKCKVGMANKGRIIVERNAKLIVDGGEIYAWGSEWAGIQVWGNYSKEQTIYSGMSPFQGVVQVINQGTLRDATNAITTGKYDQNSNLDWGGYSGGIIQCNGAKFINNQRAIQYLSYQNFNPYNNNVVDNIGNITNTLFETNSVLKDPSAPNPQVFISLWNVRGVKFYGNTYQNTRSPLPSLDKRGNGIYSIDASYTVDRYKVCSSYNSISGLCGSYYVNIPSTFKSLQYGVYVQNSTPLTNIVVNDNDFIGCNRSAYFAGTSNTRVTNNRINVGEGLSNLQFLPYGIYLENSTAYSVTNNNIYTSYYSNYNTSLATGICVNGTSGTSNKIYRNNMNLMGSGSTVYGNNQGTNPGDGLQFICNQYGQGSAGKNFADLYMAISGGFNSGKIDKVQGSSTQGANNFFSHTGNPNPSNKSDYWDGGGTSSSNLPGTIQYFYNTIPSQLTQPWYYDNPLALNAIGSPYSTNMCPVNQNGGGNGTASTARAIIAVNTASANALLAKIDGGNTQTLLNLINSNISPGSLKNDLTYKSPYLSDAALIAYFSKVNTPPGHIKEIHELNKPVNYAVWQAILNRSLPSGIMKQLNAQQSSGEISKLNVLYGEVADLNQQKGSVVDQTINMIMSDTVNGWSKDSVIALMKADNRYDAPCRLLAAYVALDRYSDATAQVATVKAAHGGTLDDFCKLQELIIQLRQQSKSIFELKTDANTKAMVMQIESNRDNGYTYAQALLNTVFNYKYFEQIDLPFNSNAPASRLYNINDTTGNVEAIVKAFKLYPNPSNGNTFLVYRNVVEAQNLEVHVFDITGKIILSHGLANTNNVYTINTQNLTPGLYLIGVIADGKMIDQQKFVKE